MDDSTGARPPQTQLNTPRRESIVRGAGVVGACLLALASMAAWAADPGAIFGLQGILWLAALALFVASCVGWRGDGVSSGSLPWTRGEAIVFAGIVALSLLTHLAWLHDIPWRFHYDEVIARLEALRFYEGRPISLFTTTWFSTTMPSMPFFYSGMLMHLVGTGLGGVRAPMALVGALTVVPVYGLARMLWGRPAAPLAGLAAATTAATVHYARVSIVNITAAFFWAACFYFLLRGLRSGRPGDLGFAGLIAGMSMYAYYGSRLLPYLLVAFFGYLLVVHFRLLKTRLRQFALVPAGFLVGFGPLLAYFAREPHLWASRGLSQLNVPAEFPATWEALVSDWSILAPILWENILGFGLTASRDGTYFAPLLLPVQAVLFFAGFAILLFRWKRPEYFLLLLWITAVVFVGGTLVDGVHAPAFARWTAAFPAIIVTLTLPLTLLIGALRPLERGRQRAALAALGVGVVAVAGANIYFYLVEYPRSVPPAFESAQGRYLAGLPPDVRVRFVGDSWQRYFTAVGDLMAPHVRGSDLLNPSRSLPLPPSEESELLFIFNTDQTQYLSIFRYFYPGGESGQIETPGGPIGATYRVRPNAAGSGEANSTPSTAEPNGGEWGLGLAATVLGREVEHRIDPFIGASLLGIDPDTGTPLPEPPERDPDFRPFVKNVQRGSRIRWEGDVYVSGGTYRMELRTDAHVRLMIGGKLVLDLCGNPPREGAAPYRGGDPGFGAEVTLPEGWHPVRLDMEITGRDNGLEWFWLRPDGVREIVPPTSLRHRRDPASGAPAAWPEIPETPMCAPSP
jgi:hypothetical protein